MGIHLMPPLYQQVVVLQGPLIAEYDDASISSDSAYLGRAYGRTIKLAKRYRLTRIDVKLNFVPASDVQPSTLILQLREEGIADGVLPALLAQVEVTNPGLSINPAWGWVTFPLQGIIVEANTRYSWWLVGTASTFEHPQYRIQRTNGSGLGLDVAWLRWRGDESPPHLDVSVDATRAQRIYGVSA